MKRSQEEEQLENHKEWMRNQQQSISGLSTEDRIMIERMELEE